ncbi:MAG: PhaM family polyhydroxyalkanoate granule multifunctional regulatory protein [Leptothrix sp. (in: b-proteobacteria)]
MADATSFTKLVPGFDFLQGLVKNAGSALPSMGQWIAPTLDPVELDRRIQELKTVQFWLEQNARMISATIQALEVQRMTLNTLQGMNVSVGNLQEALKIQVPSMADVPKPAAKPAPAPAPAASAAQGDDAEAAAGVVDPMQWWNSLTQQFTQLATNAMQAAGEAAQNAAQTAAQTAATATANATAAAAAVAASAAPAETEAESDTKPARKTSRSRRAAT